MKLYLKEGDIVEHEDCHLEVVVPKGSVATGATRLEQRMDQTLQDMIQGDIIMPFSRDRVLTMRQSHGGLVDVQEFCEELAVVPRGGSGESVHCKQTHRDMLQLIHLLL